MPLNSTWWILLRSAYAFTPYFYTIYFYGLYFYTVWSSPFPFPTYYTILRPFLHMILLWYIFVNLVRLLNFSLCVLNIYSERCKIYIQFEFNGKIHWNTSRNFYFFTIHATHRKILNLRKNWISIFLVTKIKWLFNILFSLYKL